MHLRGVLEVPICKRIPTIYIDFNLKFMHFNYFPFLFIVSDRYIVLDECTR